MPWLFGGRVRRSVISNSSPAVQIGCQPSGTGSILLFLPLTSFSFSRAKTQIRCAFCLQNLVHEPVVSSLGLDPCGEVALLALCPVVAGPRSEERRGGHECVRPGRHRWSPSH